MRNSLRMMSYLLYALLIFALSGCGATGTTTAMDNGTANGKITANLVLPKSTGKTVGSAADVVTTRLKVTGAAIPTATKDFKTSTGGSLEVYPGSDLIVTAEAFDTNGVMIYEGFATSVTVVAGQPQTVSIQLSAPLVKAQDAACVGCHDNSRDVTGQNLVADFKQSGHYINQSWAGAPLTFAGAVPGAGCAGCHGPSHNIVNPYDGGTSARCFDCHNINNVNATLTANHATYYLANSTECSACHQPHNTVAGNMERKSWAQSRHGATDFANLAGGAAFNNCANRCHNAQGFITAVNNPTSLVQGSIPAQSQQMITCNACHSDATQGKLRALPGTKATAFAVYTTSTKGYQFAPNQVLNPNKKAYYPDVAGSNLCIVCHSGTTEGLTTALGMSDPYFAGSSQALTYTSGGVSKPKTTLTPHNMPAAAVMYAKFGFTNLSTGSAGVPSAAYIASLTSDLDGGSITSTHRKFGTSAIKTDSHFSASKPAPANLLANGPCAVCHVNGSHTFKIDQAAINAVCSNCHTSENGVNISTETAFMNSFVEPQKEVFNNAILLATDIINQKVAAYNLTAAGIATPLVFAVGIDPANSTQPGKVVFYTTFKAGGNYNSEGALNVNSAAITDFSKAAIALGYSTTGYVAGSPSDLGFQKFLGALSNIAFLAKDQGAFAHARTYSRRLIYDSLDFLDDGSLDGSVSQTAITLSNTTGTAVAGLYTKGTAAYNTASGAITTPFSGTSESMLYLIGWNRTSGAWTSPERP